MGQFPVDTLTPEKKNHLNKWQAFNSTCIRNARNEYVFFVPKYKLSHTQKKKENQVNAEY